MVQMEVKAPKVKDAEIDLEKGMNLSVEDQSKDTVCGVKIQAKELFCKICGVFVDSRIGGVNWKGNSTQEVKLEEGNSPLNVMVKEKREKGSNPKPPRPPRGPSLDPADQRLIREITEIAMLKRARVERMKTLKKIKAPSSFISNAFAMVLTLLFFMMVLFQGN